MTSRRRTILRWWLGTLLSGAILSPTSASASKIYGYYMISALHFSPGCEGCHNNVLGGFGTVTKPFGVTMMRLGLVGEQDENFLIGILDKLGDADSDGDGVTDADEVLYQGDPNDPMIVPEGFTANPPGTASMAGTGMNATGASGAPSGNAPGAGSAVSSAAAGSATAPPSVGMETMSHLGSSADDSGCAVTPTEDGTLPRGPFGSLLATLATLVALSTRRRCSRSQ